jgi:FAD/FMN-containing dehydrogenase
MTQDDALLAALKAACGEAGVLTAIEDRRYFAADTHHEGATPFAVLRPATVEALQAGVAAATAAGLAIHPRGGGMSYTDAYLPQTARAVVIDTSALNRIVTIDTQALFVTVEAGVTWAQLDAALKPHGLRTPFWGPFSGYTATVGGSLSQGTATFGTSRVGTSGDNVLAFDIVLADGRLLTTGSGGQPHHLPFTRQYGPDLTGLFANDAGRLGVKARITLPLEPRPALVDGMSVRFTDFATLCTALERIARDGLASECVAMDPVITAQFSGVSSFKADLAMLWRIAKSAGTVWGGFSRALKVILGGRGFLSKPGFLANIVVEAESQSALKHKLARVAAATAAGTTLPNTAALAIRAQPFYPLPVISPDGKQVLPIHGIVPFSQGVSLDRAIMAIVAANQAQIDACGALVVTTFFTIARNGLLYEPVFYWPDVLSPAQERRTPPDMLSAVPRYPDNPTARALVARLQREMIDVMYQHGATHLQIGRLYPFTRARNAPALDLLRAVKAELDPQNLMNPGALGL